MYKVYVIYNCKKQFLFVKKNLKENDYDFNTYANFMYV